MPIIRYFVFVGGLLLALLFAVDRYAAAPTEPGGVADPDKTTIRIQSARSLPEKIVFDTRPRTDLPAPPTAELSSGEREHPPREAMAAVAEPPVAAEVKKVPPAGAHSAGRRQARRWTAPVRRPADRRLALERHDFFAGGSW
jgi:hypothetical protein